MSLPILTSFAPVFGLTAAVIVIVYLIFPRRSTFLTSSFQPLLLDSKVNVAPSTLLLTFRLPSNQSLGLTVGQHVLVRARRDGKEIVRPYTPITRPDEKGLVQLLVKVYEKGNITRVLQDMKVGDSLEFKGPAGVIEYKGQGLFRIGKELRGVRKVLLVGGGTGITPLYQVIQNIVENQKDDTELFLLYANATYDDILLKKQLDAYALTGKLKIYFTLDKPKENWDGGIGYVSVEMLKNHGPAAGQDTIALLCGPPPMVRSVESHLKTLGFSPESIKFF